jgi:hypothetical protein
VRTCPQHKPMMTQHSTRRLTVPLDDSALGCLFFTPPRTARRSQGRSATARSHGSDGHSWAIRGDKGLKQARSSAGRGSVHAPALEGISPAPGSRGRAALARQTAPKSSRRTLLIHTEGLPAGRGGGQRRVAGV